MWARSQRQAATSEPCAACSSSSARVKAASICMAQVSAIEVVLSSHHQASLRSSTPSSASRKLLPPKVRSNSGWPISSANRPSVNWRVQAQKMSGAAASPLIWPSKRSSFCFAFAASGCFELRLAQVGQQPLGGERLHVGLHRGQGRQRVLGRRREQLLDALLAVRRRPFAGQEVRIVGRMDALVGGRDPAARRIDLARREPRLEEAGPVVARVPARRGHQALQVVVGLAQRHAAGRDLGDVAVAVGDDHVLHRRDVARRRVDELGHRARLVHRQARVERARIVVEREPAHRDGVGRCAGRAGQALGHRAGVRDHRAVAGAPHRDRHVGAALDVDRLGRALEAREAIGRLVAASGRPA